MKTRVKSSRHFFRPTFEFQRGGPYIKGSAAHIPDLSLSITRPSIQLQQAQQSIILPNTSRSIKTQKTTRRKLPNTLDMFTIGDACGTLSYEDAQYLNLSSRKLNNVDIDSFKMLKSIIEFDVSDNSLPLEPFTFLHTLEILDFSCNNLSNFSNDKIPDKSTIFPSLKRLNMNYNSIGQIFHYFSAFPNLTQLTATNNNLTFLPKNTSQFMALEYLDLTNNSIHSEESFSLLANFPNLKTLILDNNNIEYIPKLQYGFEKLSTISLKNNRIEASNDIISLTDLENLRKIDITNNPILVFRKDIEILQLAYSENNIEFICPIQEEPKRAPRKYHLNNNLFKVDKDPLLSSTTKEITKRFSEKAHKENTEKVDQPEEDETDYSKKSTEEKVETDVFMTDFSQIPETPLPIPQNDTDEENEIQNIWKEVPVIQEENRKLFTTHRSIEKYNDAFKKLKYIVEHPNIRLETPKAVDMQSRQEHYRRQYQNKRLLLLAQRQQKTTTDFSNDVSNIPSIDLSGIEMESSRYNVKPRPNSSRVQLSTIPLSNDNTQTRTTVNMSGIMSTQRERLHSSRSPRRKEQPISIEEKLKSSNHYSKAEVLKMLQSMESRLNDAEDIIDQEDEDGMNPVDRALDQTNFSTLNKEYESIRTEIVNTLQV